MKALNLHAVGDLRYEDVPMPVRQAGEVLLKVHARNLRKRSAARLYQRNLPFPDDSRPRIRRGDRRSRRPVARRPSCRSLPAAAVPKMRSLPGGRIRTVQRLRLLRLAARRRFRRIHRREGVEPGLLRRLALLRGGRDVRTGRRSASRHRSGVVGIGDTVAVFGAGPIGIMLACGPELPARSASSCATSIRPKSNSRANRDSTQ